MQDMKYVNGVSPSPETNWDMVDLGPDFVGDYVRWSKGGSTVLILPHSFLKKYSDHEIQQEIMYAYFKGCIAECLCKKERVEVSYFLRGGNYVTAAFPHTAVEHDCLHFRKGGHPKGFPVAPPNIEAATSRLGLRVRWPLFLLETSVLEGSHNQDGRESESYQRRSQLEVTTLMQEIFRAAGCMRWNASLQKTDSEVLNAIRIAVGMIDVNDEPLAKSLHVVHLEESDPTPIISAALLSKSRRGAIPLHYVLARAKSLEVTLNDAEADGFLKVEGIEKPFKIGAVLLGLLRKSRWREYCRMKAKKPANCQTVVVLSLFLEDGELAACALTPHLASPQWLLVQSLNESKLVHQAAIEGLQMERSYRRDDNGLFVPDLYIYFNGRKIRVEVWGLTNLEYRLDMAAKRKYMRDNGILFIEWDAAYFRSVPELTPLILDTIAQHESQCESLQEGSIVRM